MAPWEQIIYSHQQWLETGRKQRGRWIIFRKNLKNLNDIIQRTKEVYPALDPAMGMNGWGKVEKRWEFTSGYVVDLAHLDGPDDHLGYNGQELSGFSIDQAEEISEDVYNFLFMQVRSRDEGMKLLLKILLTANPGGRYAAWIKRRFVEGCKPHNRIHRQSIQTSKGPVETTSAFIPAKLSDNKYLADDGRYEANLLRLPEHMRRMYLDGDWDVVIGSRFAHLWQRPLHVIKSFPVPGSWQVKGGLDWGSTNPACWHIAARDNDDNVYFIDELYGPGVTGRTFGEKMLKKVQNQRWSADRKWTVEDFYTLMDQQARSGMGGDGPFANAAAGIASYGFRLFDANKDRAGRVEQWSERLLTGTNGKPRVYIFGDRCPQLAQVIPTIPSDPHNPDDCDQDFENDHPYDSSSFLLMDWPLRSKAPEKQGVDKDVERWLAMAKRRQQMREDADVPALQTGYGD
jgi:phage terminase large subunit